MGYEIRRCSCGVRMLMLRHERTGFVAPINPEVMPTGPYPVGNIVVDLLAGTYRVVPVKHEVSDEDRAQMRLNHFVTCPDRSQYRRRMGASVRADLQLVGRRPRA